MNKELTNEVKDSLINTLNLYVTIPYIELSVNKSDDLNCKKSDAIIVDNDFEKSIVKIYVNKFCNSVIKSFEEFKSVFKSILFDLKITEYSILKVTVAIDTNCPVSYDKLNKINRFIINTDYTRISESGTPVEISDTYNRYEDLLCYSLSSETYRHTFYNKANTENYMIEFSYIGMIGNNPITFEQAINQTIDNYKKMIDYTDITVDRISDNLFKQYISERSGEFGEYPGGDRVISNFTDFVVKYSHVITTSQLMTALYKKCMNGNASSWLIKYRKHRAIYLPKKHIIYNYINMNKKALKNYKNS